MITNYYSNVEITRPCGLLCCSLVSALTKNSAVCYLDVGRGSHNNHNNQNNDNNNNIDINNDVNSDHSHKHKHAHDAHTY